MSSKKYAAPLHLDILPSRYLLILLFCLHFFSFVLLFFMPIPTIYLFFSIALILLSAIYTLMYQANILPKSIVGLIWDIDDDWFILQKNGEKKSATLDGNSFIHPFFSILNFKQDGRVLTRSVILLKDNINQNVFRRLRVRLKVTGVHKETDG